MSVQVNAQHAPVTESCASSIVPVVQVTVLVYLIILVSLDHGQGGPRDFQAATGVHEGGEMKEALAGQRDSSKRNSTCSPAEQLRAAYDAL